jgi:ribosome maturation protein Sdo1
METDAIFSTLSTSARNIGIQEDALKEVSVKKDTFKDADFGVEEPVGEIKPVFIYTMFRTSILKVKKKKVNQKRFA